MALLPQARRMTAIGAFLISGVLMTACVQTSPDDGTSPGSTPSETAQAPGTDPGGDQSVTWWAWNAFDKDRVIEDFEAEHPGITIDFKQYSYNDYVTAIRTGLTSNDGPDVFQLQPGELVENFGAFALDLDDYLTAAHGEDWAEMFYEEGIAQLQLDGTQVGLASYMSAAGFIYYNATVLDELELEVPTDFEEWQQVCQVIQDNGMDCLAHGAMDAWVNTDVYLSIINSIAPGAVYEAIAGERSWTDPEFVQAMESWHELFDSGIIGRGATAMAEYPDAFGAFLEKKAAFIALGTWNTPGTMTATGVAESQQTVTETIDSIYLSAPFPAPLSGGDPTAPFGGPDSGWAVSQNAENQEAALAFLDFLAIGGGQDIQAAGGNIPGVVDKTVATDDVLDERQVADIEGQQEALLDLVGARQIPYPELGTALGDALSGVAAGTQSPADAMAQVENVSAGLTR